MARSPLTLAASVTSALPRVVVTGVGVLSEGASGRYDSAIAELEDGRRVVVRVPVDDDADADLRAESRALASLTAGVRGVLPFGAPDVLGETRVDGRHTLVQTLLPGYRVDAAEVPEGPGIATALGAAIAQVHDLPVAVIRDAGLPVQTASQVRDEAERLLDRAESTGRLPFGLLRRWSTALATDALWRFETTVVLGGVDPASFVFEDDDEGIPVVTGLLSWGALSVGDPAIDLRWTAGAAAAREDVLEAYAAASHRAPDPQLAERARLHAELEFARWLVHGETTGSPEVIADAVALLATLDESVRDLPAVAHEETTADDAIAASARVPAAAGPADTSMHTDTFDPEALAQFLSHEPTDEDDPERTMPVELSDWAGLRLDDDADLDAGAARAADEGAARPADEGAALAADEGAPVPGYRRTPAPAGDEDDVDVAARNALRRWTGTE